MAEPTIRIHFHGPHERYGGDVGELFFADLPAVPGVGDLVEFPRGGAYRVTSRRWMLGDFMSVVHIDVTPDGDD